MSKCFILMLKTFLLFVIILYSFASYPQTNLSDSLKIDSLKKVLQIQKEDTNKVNTLNELSESTNGFFYVKDYHVSLQFANSALILSNKLNYIKGKGRSLQNIANVYSNNNKFVEAL